jgi:LacI family transcriptional regulator
MRSRGPDVLAFAVPSVTLDLADLRRRGAPVCVVAYDTVDSGRRAAELLFARIGGDDRPAQCVRISRRVVARGSGAIQPA